MIRSISPKKEEAQLSKEEILANIQKQHDRIQQLYNGMFTHIQSQFNKSLLALQSWSGKTVDGSEFQIIRGAVNQKSVVDEHLFPRQFIVCIMLRRNTLYYNLTKEKFICEDFSQVQPAPGMPSFWSVQMIPFQLLSFVTDEKLPIEQMRQMVFPYKQTSTTDLNIADEDVMFGMASSRPFYMFSMVDMMIVGLVNEVTF